MTQSTIAADVPEPRDILLVLPAQGTLDSIFAVEYGGQARCFLFRQLLGLTAGVHLRLGAKFQRSGRPDPVNIAQRNMGWLVVRQVDTQDTRHIKPFLK